MLDVYQMLSGGDRRSVGRVGEVVAAARSDPGILSALVSGLRHENPLVRMRCADALEKLTTGDATPLLPFKTQLLETARKASQQEVRWHMAQVLPRLAMNPNERIAAVETLFEYLRDGSKIVQAFSLDALVCFAEVDNEQGSALRAEILPLLQEKLQTGSPAVRARCRMLLARLANQER
ncbi:MAG: hypothetical protein EHM70_10165 [Chloroflexota bacterium]|nr:MAG: hypothetical protein EHM70_10165 [Chloroflexota bacterium]